MSQATHTTEAMGLHPACPWELFPSYLAEEGILEEARGDKEQLVKSSFIIAKVMPKPIHSGCQSSPLAQHGPRHDHTHLGFVLHRSLLSSAPGCSQGDGLMLLCTSPCRNLGFAPATSQELIPRTKSTRLGIRSWLPQTQWDALPAHRIIQTKTRKHEKPSLAKGRTRDL